MDVIFRVPTPSVYFCAAYAGHTVLNWNQLFPWRWAKHAKAIKDFVAGIDAKKLAAAESRGREAGTKVITERCVALS